jgi:phosphoribosylformimino-5-aminoimidazole carboxamide ribotide isomerase
MERFPSLNLIASGGVSCYEDLILIKEAGCSGAIIGKAIYEGKISLQQIQDFIRSN